MNTLEQTALETIRQRLLHLLAAVGAPASAQAGLTRVVQEMDTVADAILARQVWDPASPEHGNVHGQPLTHAQFTIFTNYFGLVRRLVTAWRCPFSRHYQQPEILERALAGLRFGERYVRPDRPRDGSWYMWDIGFPMSLSYQCLLLGEHLPADLRQRIVEDLAHMPAKVFTLDRDRGITRPPIASGSNNVDVLYIGFLRGLVLNDPQWLTSVLAQVPVAMGRTTGSEGLQNDWSYQFHGHGVNAGYGLGCLGMQAHWLYLTQGTPWQVPAAVRELHVGMIREFFARNIWCGRVAPYSTDRGIVSPKSIYVWGYLSAILYGFATDLPPQDKAVFAAAAADYLRSLDPEGQPMNQIESDSATEVSLLPALLMANLPQPLTADLRVLAGIRYYPDSEYLLARQANWFAAIRMSSGRTSTWKSQLGANTVGSSTAEFTIAFMTDGREYDHTTIPTMNWKRLMGVTRCDAIEPPPEGYGQSTFCGGVAGDEFAVLGLQYLLAPAGQDTLRANKSVFVAPEALVLLGSEIRCDSAVPVVTTLFHAPVIPDGPYRRNAAALDVSRDGIWEIKAGETLHLRNVGVRLLTDAQLIVETRKGTYADLNMMDRAPEEPKKRAAWLAVYERRWVCLVVNHGIRPTAGRYGAILFTGAAPEFKILHEAGHHRVARPDDQAGGEVRFPGDWRKKIGLSYWGAEQHQWGSIARWTPADAPGFANLEITPPARFVRGSENANTEIFLPAGLEQENVTLKTYEGRPFPANLLSLPAKGQVLKLRVRRVPK